ncbi:bifunctional metallophosphatase/5'-nucleotidase [Acinetobacter qingfengensis]|uniref:Bifunctional metallophosphatase/5'-nucleotidase n=1 Tax=Acinetobacter qingfengensis TaxID=1262585 RepID=A0A1E7RAP2_9GAMM|nr:bifunctional metallophosphatase/5'-nucleotidase [Acinetobacter qingfengensis]KAA8734807.1 bifunctional metallophosphatase/5'-nucleotidase [Acinetobacter qingfengensis]OEY96434.1 bifunctional metallophosphatase/5'-nucleotidase [Acinetobacter qingfengensis]
MKYSALIQCSTLSASILAFSGCSTTPISLSKTVSQDSNQVVDIIAFNDFHGNIEPPKRWIIAPKPLYPNEHNQSIKTIENQNLAKKYKNSTEEIITQNSTKKNESENINVPAGGVTYLADAIQKLRVQNPNNIVVSAGDLIGASPLISSYFLDEPTIDVMNDIHIDLNAVGNHEFDRDIHELQRKQNGGCQQFTTTKPCQINKNFMGAQFNFLAANVTMKKENHRTIFPAYKIKKFGGIPVAFIGLTLKGTPDIVSMPLNENLDFHDEAKTINALIPELKKQGIEAIVVVIHEGVSPSTKLNEKTCKGLSGPLLNILEQLNPAIDIVISGHTHQSYICDYSTVNPAKPFLLTSAGQYGMLVTDIRIELDAKTKDIIKKDAKQIIVQGEGFSTNTTTLNTTPLYEKFNKTPSVEAILKPYRQAIADISNQIIGRAISNIERIEVKSGESPLGNLIADAQQASAKKANKLGSDFALMNSGGVRAQLQMNKQNEINYGNLFSIQPFENPVVTLSLTGKQIKALLEQQWSDHNPSEANILYPSQELSYQYSIHKPLLSKVSNIKISGIPLDENKIYRVTANKFLAEGGNNFSIFKQGQDRVESGLDIDALVNYIKANSPISAPKTTRIKVID